MLYLLSESLTTGQVTFIFRVVIQILSYGGLFLIGLIVLVNTPRIAPLETHDTLNRVVGKSTATSTTVRWIKKRVFSRNQDPSSTTPLLIALILSLTYGLFVAVSDIDFIGLQECSVPYPPYTDFPASIRSLADAKAALNRTVIPGGDINKITSFRCTSAHALQINENSTINACDSWDNSTYGDPTTFRSLNLTDTEALMFRNLGPDRSKTGNKEMQVYYFGALGMTVKQAKIDSGLAVVPHQTGVRTYLGAPDLTRNQSVMIPKTMLIDVSVGCLPLGLSGDEDPASLSSQRDYYQPDDKWKATLRKRYTGPDNLFQPLSETAEQLRRLVVEQYNMSVTTSDGFPLRTNSTSIMLSWTTQVSTWYPSDLGNNEQHRDILGACGEKIHQALNVTVPRKTRTLSKACATIALTGSNIQNATILRGYAAMLCASTTSFKMVATTLNIDQDGVLTDDHTPIPSDIHEIKGDIYHVKTNSTINETMYITYGSARRFTLSDNPAGRTDHYILQEYPVTSSNSLSLGPAGVGDTLPQVGSAMIETNTVSSSGDEQMVNGTFFSCTSVSSAVVTKWAGQRGAALFLSSYAFNAYVGLNRIPLTVRSTGGKQATCYSTPFFLAFLPLLLAALLVVGWCAALLATSKLRGSKLWEKRYGGLAPTIVAPVVTKWTADEILVWEDDGETAHLRPVHGSPTIEMPLAPYEMSMSVSPKF